jgi:hypothetical protein
MPLSLTRLLADPAYEWLAVAPGRFGHVITRVGNGVHALNHVREVVTSSFALALDADGTATLCRGWRYTSSNDGPELHEQELIEEQLGYRGRWRPLDGQVEVDLERDATVCPDISRYTRLIPRHETRWRLVCASLAVSRESEGALPILACELDRSGPAFGEDEPHLVPGLLPFPCIALGIGNALALEIETDPTGETPRRLLSVEMRAGPIPADAWRSE